MKKNRIFFVRDLESLIRTYGDVLGKALFDSVNQMKELDKSIGVPPKPYYTFRIDECSEKGKGYLLVW